MIELVRDLRTINVLAKFENDPWKIMDVRVLTGLVCPAARPPAHPPARPPARGTTIPRSLKGCGVKKPYWNTVKNGTYVQQPVKISKCAKFEGSNLKIDIVKAKNAEITNYGIMHIFD